jgi:hypothetical protein
MAKWEQIKKAVESATQGKQKIATFHYQVLRNADDLEGTKPDDFCRDIGVPKSYETEFRKMLSLARLLREKRVRIS